MDRELDIEEIRRIVLLIQKIDCRGYAYVTDAARELGVRKTALMQYIEDHPKLFKMVEVEKPKGLAISRVYLAPDLNPETDEWVARMKDEWKNKIRVFGQYYYGVLEFFFIDVDSNSNRANLWRNTPEKIQSLADAGLIKKVRGTCGGIGDCWTWEGYRLDAETAKAITDAGWELVYPED